MTSKSFAFPVLSTTGLALLGTLGAHAAADYNYGSLTQDFTIPLTDKGRTIAPATTINNTGGDAGIYWRGSASDLTCVHFDLGMLQGMTLNGDVTLNATVNATWGGNTTGSKINTADGPWTAAVGAAAPAYTAVADATNSTGNIGGGQTASWTIPGATFATYVGSPTFNGFVLSGASGTTAHFTNAISLTGNYTGGVIRVVGGTDWSAAVWNDASMVLSLSGSATVTGGNLYINSGAEVAVMDAASLEGGNFAGAIGNSGSLYFNTSANQTLTGALSGAGMLTKEGASTLTIESSSCAGPTILNGGTLKLNNVAPYRSSTFIGSGSIMEVNVPTNVSAPNSCEITGSGTFVKKGAGTWQVGGAGRVHIAMSAGGLIDVREGMLQTGNHQQSWTGNLASMNIEAGASIDLPAENLPVDSLTGAGSIINGYAPSGGRTVSVGVANGGGTFSGTIGSDGLLALTKMGTGTQILTGANTYDLATNINGGVLRIDGDHSGATGVVNVNSGGTLAGIGTLGGAISVKSGGILAPGVGLGTLHAKNVGLLSGGTLAVEINGDNSGSDLLEVTGNLDLGSATLTASNLGATPLADGLKFTIATYTGTLTGTFNGIPEGGTLFAGENAYTVRYADGGNNITITSGASASPFGAWMATNYPGLSGADAEPGADPDGDGLSNLAEFAFKGDPTLGTNRGLTAVGTVDTNGNSSRELILTVAVRSGAVFTGSPSPTASIDGVTYTIQGSTDLSSFTAGATETTALSLASTGLPDISGSGWEYHSFALSSSEGLSGKGFLRAKAE